MAHRNPLLLPFTLLLMGITAIASADNKDKDKAKPVVSIPEPGTALLLGTGLVALGLAARRRANQKKK